MSFLTYTGISLRAFIGLTETLLFGAVRGRILAANGYTQVLEGGTFNEEPLLLPNTAGWKRESPGWNHVSIPQTDAWAAAAAAAVATALGPPGSSTEAEPSQVLRYHQAYNNGTTTPSAVAERFVKALEDSEAMRFLIAYDPAALRAQAAASTARFAAGAPLSIIDGVMFAVKDEYDVEGYPTTAGTAFLADLRPCEGTMPGVATLLAAGALCVGKASMHEIGLGTTGLNTVHDTPRNPHDPSRHTGGSSSGSAALVAAGLCAFAVGADGGGSIRIPAALCGVVGLKPTHSRVCALPGPPIASSVGVAGPIAHSVRDCAVLYAFLANTEGHAQFNLPSPPQLLLPDLTPAALSGSKHPLAGLTVGVHWAWFQDADPAVVAACSQALELMKAAGAEVVPVVLPGLAELSIAHAATISPEMRSCMASYYRVGALRRQMNAETRISLATAAGFSSDAYLCAQKIRRRGDAALRRVFEHCDVLTTPSVPCVAPPVLPGSLQGGASDLPTTMRLMRFCQLANMLGCPGISVPVGAAAADPDGAPLPIGLQLMAAPWHEATLLRTAAVVEAALGPAARPRPQMHWDLLAAE